MNKKIEKTEKLPDPEKVKKRAMELKNVQKLRFIEKTQNMKQAKSEFKEYQGQLSDKEMYFLYSLRRNRSNITRACEIIGEPRSWYTRSIKKNPLLEELKNEIDEELFDEVERSFLENCVENKSVSAQMFFLRTKCKHRGYTDDVASQKSVVVDELNFQEIK
jgi:hypothetical protein